MTAAPRDELDLHLDWLRYVESMDEPEARRRLRGRLRADVDAARSQVRIPAPWPAMTPTVHSMLDRDSEIVRLHRLVTTVPPGSRILDVGCGPGVVAGTLALHGRVEAYLGIDLNEGKIDSAREMAASNRLGHLLRFEVGNALELPTEAILDLAPDIVLLLEVLEHLRTPAEVLSSIADIVPERTHITFSVPILGRIEACWGHRSLYGADAIVGLVDVCGLRLVSVEEVHNTWALATVTRHRASGDRGHTVVPTTIQHVDVGQLRVDGALASTAPRPARLQFTVHPGQTVHVDASTPGADWVRVDVGSEPPGSLTGIEIETLDAEGEVIRRWVPELGRLSDSDRSTFVVRSGDAAVTGDRSAPAHRTRVVIRSGAVAADVTIWRLGFAAGYGALHRPPRTESFVSPSTNTRRGIGELLRQLARRTVLRSPRARATARRAGRRVRRLRSRH